MVSLLLIALSCLCGLGAVTGAINANLPSLANTTWNWLGPFPATTAGIGGDVLEAFGGIKAALEDLKAGRDVLCPSDITQGGYANWSNTTSGEDGFVQLNYSMVDFDALNDALGPAAYSVKSWAVANFEVPDVGETGSYLITCGGVSSFYIDGHRLSGDVYALGWWWNGDNNILNGEWLLQAIQLEPGTHTILLSARFSFKCMFIDPAVHLTPSYDTMPEVFVPKRHQEEEDEQGKKKKDEEECECKAKEETEGKSEGDSKKERGDQKGKAHTDTPSKAKAAGKLSSSDIHMVSAATEGPLDISAYAASASTRPRPAGDRATELLHVKEADALSLPGRSSNHTSPPIVLSTAALRKDGERKGGGVIARKTQKGVKVDNLVIMRLLGEFDIPKAHAPGLCFHVPDIVEGRLASPYLMLPLLNAATATAFDVRVKTTKVRQVEVTYIDSKNQTSNDTQKQQKATELTTKDRDEDKGQDSDNEKKGDDDDDGRSPPVEKEKRVRVHPFKGDISVAAIVGPPRTHGGYDGDDSRNRQKVPSPELIQILPGQAYALGVELSVELSEEEDAALCGKKISTVEVTFEVTASFNDGKDRPAAEYTLPLDCRSFAERQEYRFTFLDTDNSVQYATIKLPQTDCTCPTTTTTSTGRSGSSGQREATGEQFLAMAMQDEDEDGGEDGGCSCNVLVALHGASVDAGSNDWYGAVPSFNKTFVILPTNRGAYGYNWESAGKQNLISAILALKRTLPGVPEESKASFRADIERLMVVGHSMGGHGCFVFSTQFPDTLMGSLCASAWIKRDEYSFPTTNQDRSYTDRLFRALLAASQQAYDTDILSTHLVGIPFLGRAGGADLTVPAYLLRRFVRVLRQREFQYTHKYGSGDIRFEMKNWPGAPEHPVVGDSKTVLYSEVPGEGHWWGEVVSAQDLTPYYEAVLKDGQGGTEPLLREWTTTTPNVGVTMSGKNGLVILQTFRPHQQATIHATLEPPTLDSQEPKTWTLKLKTHNVRRFGLKANMLQLLSHGRDTSFSAEDTLYLLVDDHPIPFKIANIGPYLLPQAHLCTSSSGWDKCDDSWWSTERNVANAGPFGEMMAQGAVAVIYPRVKTEGVSEEEREGREKLASAALSMANRLFTVGKYGVLLFDDETAVNKMELLAEHRVSYVVLGSPPQNTWSDKYWERSTLGRSLIGFSVDHLFVGTSKFTEPDIGLVALASVNVTDSSSSSSSPPRRRRAQAGEGEGSSFRHHPFYPWCQDTESLTPACNTPDLHGMVIAAGTTWEGTLLASEQLPYTQMDWLVLDKRVNWQGYALCGGYFAYDWSLSALSSMPCPSEGEHESPILSLMGLREDDMRTAVAESRRKANVTTDGVDKDGGRKSASAGGSAQRTLGVA